MPRDPSWKRRLGVLGPHLDDGGVREIFVTGSGRALLTREGRPPVEILPRPFDAEGVRSLARLLAEALSQPLSGGRTEAGGELAPGIFVKILAPPLATDGPIVEISRSAVAQPGLTALAEGGFLHEKVAALLQGAVASRVSILIAGPRGSGRSTLLGALAREWASESRVAVLGATRTSDRAPLGIVTLSNDAGVDAALRIGADAIAIDEPDSATWAKLLLCGRPFAASIEAHTMGAGLRRVLAHVLFARAGMAFEGAEALAASSLELVIETARVDDGWRVSSIGEPHVWARELGLRTIARGGHDGAVYVSLAGSSLARRLGPRVEGLADDEPGGVQVAVNFEDQQRQSALSSLRSRAEQFPDRAPSVMAGNSLGAAIVGRMTSEIGLEEVAQIEPEHAPSGPFSFPQAGGASAEESGAEYDARDEDDELQLASEIFRDGTLDDDAAPEEAAAAAPEDGEVADSRGLDLARDESLVIDTGIGEEDELEAEGRTAYSDGSGVYAGDAEPEPEVAVEDAGDGDQSATGTYDAGELEERRWDLEEDEGFDRIAQSRRPTERRASLIHAPIDDPPLVAARLSALPVSATTEVMRTVHPVRFAVDANLNTLPTQDALDEQDEDEVRSGPPIPAAETIAFPPQDNTVAARSAEMALIDDDDDAEEEARGLRAAESMMQVSLREELPPARRLSTAMHGSAGSQDDEDQLAEEQEEPGEPEVPGGEDVAADPVDSGGFDEITPFSSLVDLGPPVPSSRPPPKPARDEDPNPFEFDRELTMDAPLAGETSLGDLDTPPPRERPAPPRPSSSRMARARRPVRR